MKFTGERLIPKINKNTAFYYEHLNRYLFASQFSKNKIILDCACGSGYGSYILSTQGQAKQVDGVDISRESIKYANKNYSLSNIEFFIDDVELLKNVKNKIYDQIVSFETIEHIKNPSLAVSNFKKILSKNGLLIISTPNINNYSNSNQFHIHELNQKDFFSILKKHFKYVDIIYQKYFFSQQIYSISSSGKEILFNNEKYQSSYINNFNLNSSINNPEYYIAICSNKKLPKYVFHNISVDRVDNLSFKSGIIPLENKIFKLESRLSQIISSKFFKLWPIYNQIKSIFKL